MEALNRASKFFVELWDAIKEYSKQFASWLKVILYHCIERISLPIRLLERILDSNEEILRELRAIRKELKPSGTTRFIAVQFKENSMPNNVLTLNVGQSSTGTIVPLTADGATPSGGFVSNPVFSVPPSASFSALDNGDGTVTITGLAATDAPVTGTATCTVTDSGNVVSSFTTSFTVTVNAVTTTPPAAATASIAVSFSTPTP